MPRPDQPDPDERELAADLRGAVGRLARTTRADGTVPLGRLAVLGLLDREGPRTTTELATAQGVRQQSMSRTVSLLVADGLVAGTPDPDDGRKVRVALTDAGRAALTAERHRREDRLADAIATRLSARERRTLTDAVALLDRLAAP